MSYPTLRERYISQGLIKPNPSLARMYQDAAETYYDRDIVGPSWEQPWHAEDKGLRLDARGKFWAAYDVQEHGDKCREFGENYWLD